jgi:hypothetical protein
MSTGSNHASLMQRMVAFELVCVFTDEEARLGVSTALANLRASLSSRDLCQTAHDIAFFEDVLTGSTPSSEVPTYVMARVERG